MEKKMKIIDLNYLVELDASEAVKGSQISLFTIPSASATASATSELDVFEPAPGVIVQPFTRTNTVATFEQREGPDLSTSLSEAFAGGQILFGPN